MTTIETVPYTLDFSVGIGTALDILDHNDKLYCGFVTDIPNCFSGRTTTFKLVCEDPTGRKTSNLATLIRTIGMEAKGIRETHIRNYDSMKRTTLKREWTQKLQKEDHTVVTTNDVGKLADIWDGKKWYRGFIDAVGGSRGYPTEITLAVTALPKKLRRARQIAGLLGDLLPTRVAVFSKGGIYCHLRDPEEVREMLQR